MAIKLHSNPISAHIRLRSSEVDLVEHMVFFRLDTWHFGTLNTCVFLSWTYGTFQNPKK